MKVVFLPDRDEVIRATIDTIKIASVDCMGMGSQIAWIEHPDFLHALEDAVSKRNVTVRVIGVREGDVKHFADQFQDVGANVRYYPHGDVRVALADTKRAVLAFPLPCTGIHVRRRYTGLVIEHEAFCQWLKARFDEIWEKATQPSSGFWTLLKEDFLRNPATVTAGLIGALIGAAATLLAVWLMK